MSSGSLSDRTVTGILDHVRTSQLTRGHHLPAQKLADILRVSRAPVNDALQRLATMGIVQREPNRGYFLRQNADQIEIVEGLEKGVDDEDLFYSALVEACLSGKMSDRVSETDLMRQYAVTRVQVTRTLARIAMEGWAERRPAGGWEFLPRIMSRERYERAYAFRAAIESQSLLLPSFRINAAGFAKARAQQSEILEGGYERLPRASLFEMNSWFHEMLIGCGGNEFFEEALARVNRLRRLLEYKITMNRSRLPLQSKEHLLLLDILEAGERVRAAEFLRMHILGASALKSPSIDVP